MPLQTYERLSPKVHEGAWVHPSAWLLGEVVLEEGASVWPNCVLRGDNGLIHVGARTNLQDGTICHATLGVSRTTIGADCTVGHRVILHGCTVGANTLVGMGSTVMDEVEVGEWSFIGAGTLLTPGKKYPPRSFIVGAPGKRLREVTSKETEAITHGNLVYLELMKRYRGT